MANNSLTATGVLLFTGKAIVTPIIRALFGAFKLDESYPGENELYIARVSEDNSTSWSAILENIMDQSEALCVKLDEDADENEFLPWLQALGEKLGVIHGAYADLVGKIVYVAEDDCDADIELLYELAMILQDGHNLAAIKFESGWQCSKPLLLEFGGSGEFYGRQFRICTQSSRGIMLGDELEKLLVDKQLDKASEVMIEEVLALLGSISDPGCRRHIARAVANHLARENSATP